MWHLNQMTKRNANSNKRNFEVVTFNKIDVDTLLLLM